LNEWVPTNRDAWRGSVEDPQLLPILDAGAKTLVWAWSIDSKSPRSYPINTAHAFAQLEQQLRLRSVPNRGSDMPLPPSKIPGTVAELVNEKTIKAVYENQNAGSYEEALKQAAAATQESASAWRKILHAIDDAYAIDSFGHEAAPVPRLHFLHRHLLLLAESEILGGGGWRQNALQNFFDHMCPCGKTHKSDALRKLSKRLARLK
jgi:hypothetical protein